MIAGIYLFYIVLLYTQQADANAQAIGDLQERISAGREASRELIGRISIKSSNTSASLQQQRDMNNAAAAEGLRIVLGRADMSPPAP